MDKKEIDKKSEKESPQDDNNTLFYILLFLLFACLIALAVIWYYNWSASQRFSEEAFEPTGEQIEKLSKHYKTARDLVRLKKDNQRSKDSCQKKLDKNFNPKLTAKQRAQIQKKLNELNNSSNPVEFAARVRRIRSLLVPSEVQQRQLKEQENFLENIFPQKEREVKEKLDEFLRFFYEYSFQKLSAENPEKITWKWFEIANFNDRLGPFSKEDYDACKVIFASRIKEPPEPVFKGFERFLDERDKDDEEQKEGETTMGLTISGLDMDCFQHYWEGEASGVSFQDFWIDRKKEIKVRRKTPSRHNPNNYIGIFSQTRFICIRLKKEFLFSLGKEENDEWIEEKSEQEIFITDVSWENLLETIAHELAHAVIDRMMENYNKWEKEHSGDGDGKGHGPLHENYNWKIEDMIKNHPKGKEFEEWWKKASNEEN